MPVSIYDPTLDELRKASVTWEVRKGPARRVADVVCLVPDLATFLEAVGAWDREHIFPILLDDTETALRFVRSFRPARVVRFPRKGKPVSPEDRWRAAVDAVGRAWKPGDGGVSPPGDAVPGLSVPPPPGVVLSTPESPALAGAVALAAGRFQPLVRWDVSKGRNDVLTSEEAIALIMDLRRRVGAVVPEFGGLGDSCDFVTLAGDWPYRYKFDRGSLAGVNALDDFLTRDPQGGRRWAFVGRLVGGEAQCLYQAMCSLFLQPSSALLYNSYSEAEPPWSTYGMRGAAARLGKVLKVDHRSGVQAAGPSAWHRAFDPENRAGLLLINTKGHPTAFDLGGVWGQTADVPASAPTAIHIIHSFSAAEPYNPDTIAGRWLANGAFLYFGSMDEPGLQGFRTPTLVADLIAEHLPIVAAARQGPGEQFWVPWRLMLIGDPLYRLLPEAARPTRATWEVVAGWPAYAESAPPGGDREDLKLAWALKTHVVRIARDQAEAPRADLIDLLMTVRRGRLPAESRPVFDALLCDVLLHAGRTRTLRAWLAAIPAAEATPAVMRWRETVLVMDLQQAIAAKDMARAGLAWDELIRSGASVELKQFVTGRVATLADASGRLRDWQARLRSALPAVEGPAAAALGEELKRLEARTGGRGGR